VSNLPIQCAVCHGALSYTTGVYVRGGAFICRQCYSGGRP
jgi:hypothetical protein